MKFSKLIWTGAALLWTASLGTAALAQDTPAAPPPAPAPAVPSPAAPVPAAPRQGGGQGRGGYGGAPTLSTMPVSYMATVLGLSDEQKTKIQAIQDKARTDLQELRKPDANGQRPDRATLQPKMKAINDQAKKDIEAILTAAQIKKADGMVKSATVYNTAGIPLAVVTDLKLTPEQETKITAIAEDAAKASATAQKDIADARAAGNDDKTQELMQAQRDARKATQDKIMAILTDAQKTILTQYQKDHPRGGNRQQAPAGAGTI